MIGTHFITQYKFVTRYILFQAPLTTILTLLLCAFPSTVPSKQLIRVVGNHAPPFRIIIDDQDFTGIYFYTAKELAIRIGVESVFYDVPFARSLRMLEYGEADLMM